MQTETVQFNFRIPEKLKDSLRQSARINRRSMNAEIVVLLEGALLNSPQTEKADATA
jgi:hypothetical protein